MAQQNINIGSSSNKGDGDPIRVAFTKVNANFTDLFARVIVLEGGGVAVAQDIQGDIFAQDSSLAYNSATNTHYGSFVGALAGDVTGSVFADNSTVIIDGVAGTVSSSALSGNLPALDGSALTNLTIPAQTFASLTSKPTTIAGYGITDALSGAVTGSNTGTVNFTGATLNFVSTTFNGLNFDDLGTTPTTIAGYGITDALALGTSSTTALAGDTALFSGDYDDLSNKPTIPTAYTDSDVDTHLNTGSASNNEVLSWDGSDYAWVASGGSGLQSRSLRTNQTSSLADGAEADLDITGFKAYALMAITTDRAARVRLYVKAASRTADASRAEGVDPTSDAGLIAEVITTGTGAVIISPGAYGFNLENFSTSNIPCRVTNKSGSTSTVQVSLNILQLEA